MTILYKAQVLINELPRNGMESALVLLPSLLSKPLVHLEYHTENRTAEFHSAFDHSASVSPDYPFDRLWGKVRSRRRGGRREREVVEAEPDLGVSGGGYPINGAEVLDVGVWEGRVVLETLEESH